MEQSIRRFAGEQVWAMTRDRSCRLLAASPAVYADVAHRGVTVAEMEIVHDYIKAAVPDELFASVGPGADQLSRRDYRRKLELPVDGILVFGCGSIDWRKGPDLFFETAVILRNRGFNQYHFYWIGVPSEPGSDSLLEPYRSGGHSDAVVFLGLKDNPRQYILAGDIFFLSSREDPFPLAALEAAECGLPIVCFDGTGGIPELVAKSGMGYAAPAFSTEAVADVCVNWRDDPVRLSLGKAGRKRVLAEHTVHQAGPRVLYAVREAAGIAPAVSVIVPNYNYARYLRQRLDSILAQTAQDMEIIILDDASTDESLAVIAEYEHIPFVRVVRNVQNSGGVFRQWRKGLELARAEIIWIAEADDDCSTDFLETLLPLLSDPSIVIGTCASKVIDKNGIDLDFDYRGIPYMTMLSATKWHEPYSHSGREEVQQGMGSRNTIFNVSSVLFRKPSLQLLDDSVKYAMCGDWLFYLNMLKTGGISYTPKILNSHRLHDNSVATKIKADFKQLISEFYQVHSWVTEHYNDLPARMYSQMRQFMYSVILPMFPEKTFTDMLKYYDVSKLKKKICDKQKPVQI
jgi:glycosyltransferase involved in cell wall biosynthesis